ncbi:MAG: sterol desaturase family protein [Candidatus Hydrogenedentota bacterium]
MSQLLLYEAVLLPVVLFHHSNFDIPPRLDAALRWVIPTPWMHWVHHSRLQPETDSNYGSMLSVWDRLFRTFRLREDPHQIELGLDGDTEEKQWRTLPGMLVRPFRSRPRDPRRREYP